MLFNSAEFLVFLPIVFFMECFSFVYEFVNTVQFAATICMMIVSFLLIICVIQ